MPKLSGKGLIKIFEGFSPKTLHNGQIRMECPFRENHSDGSGRMSFFVSPQINAYICFSCNAKGNLVKLLTTRFKVGYFEAVGMVRLEDYTPEKKEFDLDLVWDFSKAPKEFIDRGYKKETLRHFRVGMTNDERIFIPYYLDFNKPTQLVGYQTRTYEKTRRVFNSTGFDKTNYLYNLDYSYEYVVLVEGQSDVWRLHQFGYNACGLMGSNISEAQVKLLSKFKRVYLALDNDEPGRRCTELCNHHLRSHTEILLVPYESSDPGTCTKAEWVKAFSNCTDYIVYSLEMSMNWEGYLEMRDEVLKPRK